MLSFVFFYLKNTFAVDPYGRDSRNEWTSILAMKITNFATISYFTLDVYSNVDAERAQNCIAKISK